MKHFLALLALACCISISTRADSLVLSPGTQTLPVGSSATINASITGLGGPTFCIPSVLSGDCQEVITLSVISGPDAGTTMTNDDTLFFNLGDSPTFPDTLVNNGIAGTDVISASAADEESLSSNTVDVVWTAGGPAVPEPSSIALFLTGLAGLGSTKLRVRGAERRKRVG
jgi:hypothetical protein